jgi:ATP-dependent RNA helicase RhlE
MEKTWAELGLSDAALQVIQSAGYEKPTPVQSEAIPLALAGNDIIASAQTGTGKTAAFTLPMVERLAGREGMYGLVLAPTREIAQQIQETIKILGEPRGIRSAVVIGGVPYSEDEKAFESYPHILVATPGRLCDHIEKGNVWLEYIEVIVLDEADRMLDMGFSDQINRIFGQIQKNRQTLLFSATIPPSVDALARKILNEPKQVSVARPMATASRVKQRFHFLREEEKRSELMKLLREIDGPTMVFTRSKDGAQRLWTWLHGMNITNATYISSDRPQPLREKALADFKSGEARILIATDVAGRGIHVDGVAHVINFDLPGEAEDYVHRIGRTGRADLSGKATSFVSLRDGELIRAIERVLGKTIPLPRGFESLRTSGGGGRFGGGHGGGRSGGGGRDRHRGRQGRRGGGRGHGRRDRGGSSSPNPTEQT